MQDEPGAATAERILEKYRPAGAIPRSESVFFTTTPDPDYIEKVGGSGRHVYLVAPHGEIQGGDTGWLALLYIYAVSFEEGDIPEDELRRYVEQYWAGVPYEGDWEYRCRGATVIRRVGGSP